MTDDPRAPYGAQTDDRASDGAREQGEAGAHDADSAVPQLQGDRAGLVERDIPVGMDRVGLWAWLIEQAEVAEENAKTMQDVGDVDSWRYAAFRYRQAARTLTEDGERIYRLERALAAPPQESEKVRALRAHQDNR